MNESFPNWLTKGMLRGVRGFNIDAYLMALEGWRRGLTLTWYADPDEVTDMKIIGFYPLGKTFSLESADGQTHHYFYRSRGDKVSNEAVDIVHHKHQAKKNFMKAEVPSPKGISFNKDTDSKTILDSIQSLHYPLVLKPVLGSLGKGVITNIQNEAELLEAVDNIKEKYVDYDQYIVEEHIDGEEYRVYVVGDEVAAATKRVPANVVGDGVKTIEQLVAHKNELRKDNPYLRNKLIKLDDEMNNFLEKQGTAMTDIPKKDQTIRLRGQANISTGGDPIDTTDSLSDELKNVAIAAVRAIPQLHHAGVDIITNGKEHKVIEVNATAGIPMHIFPMVGRSQNVPEKIIDYYFPKTKKVTENRNSIYFDYTDIRSALRNKLAQELTLIDAPSGTFHKTRYIIVGKVQKVGFRNWIKKAAVRRGLHGYTRNIGNDRVAVIVGGNELKVKDFKRQCNKGPLKANVKEIRELEWKQPIKLGFEIRNSK